MPRIESRIVETYQEKAEDVGETEDTEIEEVKFNHVCSSRDCGHFIALHYYRDICSPTTQEYFMECVLCGKGSHVQHHLSDTTEMEAETYEAGRKEEKVLKWELTAADEHEDQEAKDQRERVFNDMMVAVPVSVYEC